MDPATSGGYCGLSDDEVTALAAGGDQEAAAEFLARHFAYLRRVAGKLGSNLVDPEDLLADALTALLTRWRAGRGPTTQVCSYVIRSMRNRVIDEARSPRSRTSALVDDLDLPASDTSATHRVELHNEFAMVRRAMARLPLDQQRVLQETVLAGRKPGELEAELGRPANAIYSLNRRAILGLRRALLQEVLEDDAPPPCLKDLARLPRKPLPLELDKAHGKGIHHIRTCPRCRAAWIAFGRISAALGFAGLLAGIQLTAGQLPTAAASPPNGRVRRGGPNPGGPAGPAPIRTAWSASRIAMISTGMVLALVAIVLVNVNLVGPSTPPVGALTSSRVAELSTNATVTRDGFAVDLELKVRVKTSWSIREFTLRTPVGARLTSAPSGWDCTQDGTVTRCVVTTRRPTGGRFVYQAEQLPADGQYQLDLTALADGEPVNLSAIGPVLAR